MDEKRWVIVGVYTGVILLGAVVGLVLVGLGQPQMASGVFIFIGVYSVMIPLGYGMVNYV